jgi:predicted nuclease with TOPRIM domain
MSGQATKPPPRKPPATGAEGSGVVQQVLAERRELMIANERLRLELEDLRGRGDRTDPRQHVLELENRALREELRTVNAELDRLREAVERVLEEIEKASL